MALLTALVVSSGSFTWLSLSQLLAVRIKLINFLLLFGYLALCVLIFSAHGFYRPRFLRFEQRIARIASATTLIVGALLALRSPFEFSFATNEFLLVFWIVSCCILALTHEFSRQLQCIARLHGRNARNIVIVGEDQCAKNLAAQIEHEPILGYRVIQIITTENGEVYHDQGINESRSDGPLRARVGR
jgi:FlaA1/EpsC-like NDP-sugar epimerase